MLHSQEWLFAKELVNQPEALVLLVLVSVGTNLLATSRSITLMLPVLS